MTRLTEEELAVLEGDALISIAMYGGARDRLHRAIIELRERRAADLSAEDVASLRWLVKQCFTDDETDLGEWVPGMRKAEALPDRLIAASRSEKESK